jgi:hypothetical protein
MSGCCRCAAGAKTPLANFVCGERPSGCRAEGKGRHEGVAWALAGHCIQLLLCRSCGTSMFLSRDQQRAATCPLLQGAWWAWCCWCCVPSSAKFQ